MLFKKKEERKEGGGPTVGNAEEVQSLTRIECTSLVVVVVVGFVGGGGGVVETSQRWELKTQFLQ